MRLKEEVSVNGAGVLYTILSHFLIHCRNVERIHSVRGQEWFG